MDPDFFRDKTKADLVDIVRMTNIMPISHAQRMRKAELVEFLEETHVKGELAPQDQAPETPNDKVASPRPRGRRKRISTPSPVPDEQTQGVTSPTVLPEEEPTTNQVTVDSVLDAADRSQELSVQEPSDDENDTRVEAQDDSQDEGHDEPAEPKARRPRPRRRRRISSSPVNQTPADQPETDHEDETEEDVRSQRSGKQYTAKPRPRRSRSKQAKSTSDKESTRARDEDRVSERDDERHVEPSESQRQGKEIHGILEIMSDGYGFIRKKNYIQGPSDIYVQPQMIRRFQLRDGDEIQGFAKDQKDQERYQALTYITSVNDLEPEKMRDRQSFGNLTPIYPNERFMLETDRGALAGRVIDLIAPIGKGQRGMIVSPPKAGKTVMMQQIANAVTTNNPEAHLMVLLIDERPEEVTDMERRIQGEVISSTFDKTPENHVKIAELVLERAKRLVELGKDVFILMDSITRLARAYNLTINPTGRTLTGGLDPGALHGPKRFFGAARNIEHGGSLTIIATALIDTGSRMDEVIFEEFKGTGNMEVHLDRKLADKRVYPAVDVQKSSTRREDLLLDERTLQAVWLLRKSLSSLDPGSATEMTLSLLKKTKSNDHFVMTLMLQKNDKAVIDAMQ